jgi:CRP/FNR family transcriptional regulator, dissimilatory nitrate respiration regulator
VPATAWLSAALRAGAIDRTLHVGQTLFRSGESAAGLYEVLKGRLRLVRIDRSGREVVLQSASPGDTLAEASLYASRYHCDAVALTQALVRLYPKTLLLAELKRDPKLAQAFTMMLARQVMELRTQLERRNIQSARDRVRHFLALNVGADGCTVALTGTVKNLAVELGLTHEALYRTLARMAAEGEIERDGDLIRFMRQPYE